MRNHQPFTLVLQFRLPSDVDKLKHVCGWGMVKLRADHRSNWWWQNCLFQCAPKN